MAAYTRIPPTATPARARVILPASFASAGFVTPEQARTRGPQGRGLMIASEGASDTGKTEFILTCPGPGMVLAWDRGFDAMIDNPEPPAARRSDFGFMVVKSPGPTQLPQGPQNQPGQAYLPYWQGGLKSLLAALGNADARTVAIDGDNVSWELQRLAEHGKLTGVFPQTKYTDVYAARRALYARCWDSGKIIIATNMMRDEYRVVMDPATGLGVPDPDKPGEFKRERTGDLVAQGFADKKGNDYYWQIRIRHLYEPPTPPSWNKTLKRNLGGKPGRYGIRVMKAKANPEMVGQELWDDQATFTGLVSLIYPNIPLSDWGL